MGKDDRLASLSDKSLLLRGEEAGLLAPWPVPEPADWLALVNRPQTLEEEEAMQLSIAKGRPYGSEHFVHWTTEALGLQQTFRERGRPRKSQEAK